MADQDPVRINGKAFSWASTSFKLGSLPITGITDVTYGDKLEKAYAYGMNRSHAPIARTKGKYVPDPLKITVHRHTAHAIREALAKGSPDGKSTGSTSKTVTIQSVEGDLPVQTVEAVGCELAEDTGTHSENADPEKEELTFSVMFYRRNGKTLFDEKKK